MVAALVIRATCIISKHLLHVPGVGQPPAMAVTESPVHPTRLHLTAAGIAADSRIPIRRVLGCVLAAVVVSHSAAGRISIAQALGRPIGAAVGWRRGCMSVGHRLLLLLA